MVKLTAAEKIRRELENRQKLFSKFLWYIQYFIVVYFQVNTIIPRTIVMKGDLKKEWFHDDDETYEFICGRGPTSISKADKANLENRGFIFDKNNFARLYR